MVSIKSQSFSFKVYRIDQAWAANGDSVYGGVSILFIQGI